MVLRAAAGLVGALLMSGCARARCFPEGVVLPQREAVLAAVDHGQGGREIMDAAFRGDAAAVDRLLQHDRALLQASDGKGDGLLAVAMSRCDEALFSHLLAAGASPDGPPTHAALRNGEDLIDRAPLILALYAKTPAFAEALLKAGANPNALGAQGYAPLMVAVLHRSRGAVRLLLDHGAAVDPPDPIGNSPLQTALGLSAFAIAEVLLDHGADPFAADVSGSTPANSVVDFNYSAEDAAAKPRVLARLRALEALPAIAPQEVRQRVMAGRWPPEGAKGPPPAPQVVATMRANWNPDGTKRGR